MRARACTQPGISTPRRFSMRLCHACISTAQSRPGGRSRFQTCSMFGSVRHCLMSSLMNGRSPRQSVADTPLRWLNYDTLTACNLLLPRQNNVTQAAHEILWMQAQTYDLAPEAPRQGAGTVLGRGSGKDRKKGDKAK